MYLKHFFFIHFINNFCFNLLQFTNYLNITLRTFSLSVFIKCNKLLYNYILNFCTKRDLNHVLLFNGSVLTPLLYDYCNHSLTGQMGLLSLN